MPEQDWEADFTRVIARNLGAALRDAGLTIDQFAKRCDDVVGEPGRFKPNTMQGLFAGKRKNITYAELIVFARALGTPLASLLVPALTGERTPMPRGEQLTPVEFWTLIALDSSRTIGNRLEDGRRTFYNGYSVRGAAESIQKLRADLASYESSPESTDPQMADLRVDRIRRQVGRVRSVLEDLDFRQIAVNEADPVVSWCRSTDVESITDQEIRQVGRRVGA